MPVQILPSIPAFYRFWSIHVLVIFRFGKINATRLPASLKTHLMIALYNFGIGSTEMMKVMVVVVTTTMMMMLMQVLLWD